MYAVSKLSHLYWGQGTKFNIFKVVMQVVPALRWKNTMSNHTDLVLQLNSEFPHTNPHQQFCRNCFLSKKRLLMRDAFMVWTTEISEILFNLYIKETSLPFWHLLKSVLMNVPKRGLWGETYAFLSISC